MNRRRAAWICVGMMFMFSLTASHATGEPQHQEPAQTAPTVRPEPVPSRPLSWFVTATSAADTNIDHNLDNLFAYGGAVGGGVQYQNRPDDPSFFMAYQTAVHRYARTDRWDRVSQHLRAVFERELSGPWELHTIGEISLKGMSEDRELSNQYILTPRLQYRIDRWRRLRAYGTLRLRRYDEDTGRNATNRYVGMAFTQRSQVGDEWEMNLRFEHNSASDPRHTYRRWTFSTEYMTPLTARDRLELGVRFRQQNYSHRLVEVDDNDVLRRDHRWVPSVDWVRAINSHAEIRLGYSLETRASNDPRREFAAHLFMMAATQRW